MKFFLLSLLVAAPVQLLAGGGHHGVSVSGMERIACDTSGDAYYDEHIDEIMEFCPTSNEVPGPFFFPPPEEEGIHTGGQSHGHGHGAEKIACDASGDAPYAEHIQELVDFCGSVTAMPQASTCPYKCAQPLEVLYRYYKKCPLKVKNQIYEDVGAAGTVCMGKCTILCSQPLGILQYHYAECGLRSKHAIYVDHENATSAVNFLQCMPPPGGDSATLGDYTARFVVTLCGLLCFAVLLILLFKSSKSGKVDSVAGDEASSNKNGPKSLMWAMATMILFSVEDFAMAHSHTEEGAEYFLPVAYVTMGVITVAVMVPLLYLPSCSCRRLGFLQVSFRAAWTSVSPLSAIQGGSQISTLVLACTYSAGFALLGAQECTTTAFSLAINSSGPLHAIMSTEVVIVCIYFYMYAGELVSWLQLLCFGTMIAGSVLIALGEDISTSTATTNFSLALLWSLMALAFYALWTITVRVSTLAGVQPLAQFLVMWLVLGGYGLVRLIIGLLDSGSALFPTSLEFWLLAILAMGLVEFAAVLCMVKALSIAVSTGLCVAVWSAHAAVVTLLVMVFDNAVPPQQQVIGMCVTLVGIILCHSHHLVEKCGSRGGNEDNDEMEKDKDEEEEGGDGKDKNEWFDNNNNESYKNNEEKKDADSDEAEADA